VLGFASALQDNENSNELIRNSRNFPSVIVDNLFISVTMGYKHEKVNKFGADKLSNTYLTTIQTNDSDVNKRVTLQIGKSFQDYHNFYTELNKLLSKYLKKYEFSEFPRNYRRSSFGIKMTNGDLLNRCAKLNIWYLSIYLSISC
jgi:hypothetical protein